MRSAAVIRRRRWMAWSACALASGLRAQPLQAVLRVTVIPDESPPELARRFAPLGLHLESDLGLKVEWTPLPDHAAVVDALVSRKVDLAWLGGFHFVLAERRSGGRVLPLVQREEDSRSRSVFVTRVDSGIRSLADLKGRTFSFGAATSPSGHLMPRSGLLAAGFNPGTDFSRRAFSGGHDATLGLLASGKVAAGVLSQSAWDRAVAERRVDPARIRVFHTTAPYVDHNWSVQAELPVELRRRLSQAFLALEASSPQAREILGLQRTARFVPARTEDYAELRQAAENAGLLK